MRAGKLRHRITIHRQVTTQDGSGARLGSWVEVASAWASIEPKTGHETPTGYAKVMTAFRLRYLEGVLPTMRIVAYGKVYDITSIVDVNLAHRELQIMAQELVGATA